MRCIRRAITYVKQTKKERVRGKINDLFIYVKERGLKKLS